MRTLQVGIGHMGLQLSKENSTKRRKKLPENLVKSLNTGCIAKTIVYRENTNLKPNNRRFSYCPYLELEINKRLNGGRFNLV